MIEMEEEDDLLSADLAPCAAGRRWSDVLVLVVQHLVTWEKSSSVFGPILANLSNRRDGT